MTVDLSPAAVAARQHAQARSGRHGGWTGAELIGVARRHLELANAERQMYERRHVGPKVRARARRASEEALTIAALQIRLAEQVPADTGYLHHLTLERIQTVRGEVARAFADGDDGPAKLAVDTHRRINEMSLRARGGS